MAFADEALQGANSEREPCEAPAEPASQPQRASYPLRGIAERLRANPTDYELQALIPMAAIIRIMRTYREWLAEGRVPRQGQKAQHYRVSDDGQHGVALFAEEQTDPLNLDDPSKNWTRVVTVEEWRVLKKKPTGKPKLKIRPHNDGVAIWVGSNKDLIAIMQQKGYRFDRVVNRWIKRPADYGTVLQTLREWGHADIEAEVPLI